MFTKLPGPKDSEGSLQCSISAAICQPHTVDALYCPILLLNVKQETFECRLEIEPGSIVSVADALFTRPLIGSIALAITFCEYRKTGSIPIPWKIKDS